MVAVPPGWRSSNDWCPMFTPITLQSRLSQCSPFTQSPPCSRAERSIWSRLPPTSNSPHQECFFCKCWHFCNFALPPLSCRTTSTPSAALSSAHVRPARSVEAMEKLTGISVSFRSLKKLHNQRLNVIIGPASDKNRIIIRKVFQKVLQNTSTPLKSIDECLFLKTLSKTLKNVVEKPCKIWKKPFQIMTIRYQLSNSKQWSNAAICSNDFQSFQSELFSRLQLAASTPRWWLLSTLDRASLLRWRRGPLSIGE